MRLRVEVVLLGIGLSRMGSELAVMGEIAEPGCSPSKNDGWRECKQRIAVKLQPGAAKDSTVTPLLTKCRIFLEVPAVRTLRQS